MRFIFLLFITTLFACDTASNIKAYNDYKLAKENYIQAVLDNNKNKKISSLKEIVKCGKFLGFNVNKYEQRLKSLSINPLKIESKYIKLISTNPIKIRLSSKMRVKFSTMKRGKYYKVFDIFGAKSRNLYQKIGNFYLRIAQNNSKKVRVVIASSKKFIVRYSIKNNYLIIHLPKQNTTIKHKIGKIIVIDPGHGGKDPGGIGEYGIKEKNIVLPVAKYLKYELNKRGYKVYLTRYTDKFITLKNRTKFANKKHADIFISLHCNISPKHSDVYGVETYFLSPARSSRAKRVAKLENSAIGNLHSTTQNILLNFLNKNRIIDSTKLSIDIQKSLIYNLKKQYQNIRDGGVRPAPFWVLVGTNMPAILIEMGYLSNKMEAKRLNSKTYQKKLAKYIADGIENYFRKNP
jgi:N-acetylmuramoyl-L-alanine amidase